jgi:hypothetical protein
MTPQRLRATVVVMEELRGGRAAMTTQVHDLLGHRMELLRAQARRNAEPRGSQERRAADLQVERFTRLVWGNLKTS